MFLTNALTGRDSMVQLKLHFPEMQQEHDAAQRVKSEGKIIVILGNVKRDLFRQAGDGEGRSANLAEKAWKAFSRTWRLSGDLLGPQAIALTRELFRVCPVVCHAPLYERDHKDSLAQDWAHIPIPRLKGVFGKLAKLGESIAILLDPLKDPSAVARKALAGDLKSLGVVWRAGGGTVAESDLTVDISHYGAAVGGWRERAPAADEEARPWWGTSTGDLYLNDGAFSGTCRRPCGGTSWAGTRVLKKWLGYREAKRREGKPLTLAEADHFRGMVHRVAALLAVRDELDRAYESAVADCFTADELGLG